jgi:biopolymer transport protein ExbB/TolQ/plasmid stabilization system protein ParE
LFLFNRSGKAYRLNRQRAEISRAPGLLAPFGPRRYPPVSTLNVFSAALLRSPLLWGGALAFACFALVHGGGISNPQVVRYLAGHWVMYAEVTLFCVGLAALGLRGLDVVSQRRRLDPELLGPMPAGGEDPASAAELAASLPAGDDYHPRRLREALDLVVRTGSADDLENHLKYLADVDAARAAAGYGLVRFIVWAIPIMGFLGTVIGITVAIANLSPTQLENISGVVAGLGTAFDTTATALALSMVLMFLQFLFDRYEQQLLADVDTAAWKSLAGRFQALGDDGAAMAVARLGETVGRGSARLLESQEQAWRALEQTAAASIRQLVSEGGEELRTSLAATLDESLGRWTESLAGVAEAAQEVARLERSLDANLAMLASSGRFEETLATLSAAVQLLAARAAAQERGDVLESRRFGKAA